MTQFFKMCGDDDCGIVEVPIHWYDVKFDDFKTYINKWAGFGKPMRVTEFACQVRIPLFHVFAEVLTWHVELQRRCPA